MKYLIPKATDTVTHETVMERRLDGGRIAINQRKLAQEVADQLAAKMTRRTGRLWQGFVDTYIA